MNLELRDILPLAGIIISFALLWWGSKYFVTIELYERDRKQADESRILREMIVTAHNVEAGKQRDRMESEIVEIRKLLTATMAMGTLPKGAAEIWGCKEPEKK